MINLNTILSFNIYNRDFNLYPIVKMSCFKIRMSHQMIFQTKKKKNGVEILYNSSIYLFIVDTHAKNQ